MYTWLYIASYIFLIGSAIGYVLLLANKGRPFISRIVVLCNLLALMGIVAGIVGQILQLGIWPLATPFQFALAFIAAIILVTLLLTYRATLSTAGIAPTLLALLLATYFFWLAPDSREVARESTPLLRNYWFSLYALTSAIGYGTLAVAGSLSIICGVWSWLPSLRTKFPEPEVLDKTAYYAMRFGFPWMTLGVVTSSIWALLAWGELWSWELKRTWALVVWLIYLFYFHARTLPEWPSKRIAIVPAIGLAVILFALLGTEWLADMVSIKTLPTH